MLCHAALCCRLELSRGDLPAVKDQLERVRPPCLIVALMLLGCGALLLLDCGTLLLLDCGALLLGLMLPLLMGGRQRFSRS